MGYEELLSTGSAATLSCQILHKMPITAVKENLNQQQVFLTKAEYS